MIKLTDLITYGREKFQLAWRVDGGIDDVTVLDKSRLMLPCFYISTPSMTITETTGYGFSFQQSYVQNIRIFYVVENVTDRTGKYAQDSIYFARQALFAAFLNKNLDIVDGRNLIFAGDTFIMQDTSRYVHAFDFQLTGILTGRDGIQEEYLEFARLYNTWEMTESSEEALPNAEDHIEIEQD